MHDVFPFLVLLFLIRSSLAGDRIGYKMLTPEILTGNRAEYHR